MGAASHINSAKQILACHDKLLFELAYPRNKKQLNLTVSALEHLPLEIKRKHNSKNLQFKNWLGGSGLPGTQLTGSFSFDITKWLATEFPGDIEIESANADPETIRLFFRAILPRTEYENISSGNLSLPKRIKKLKGDTTGSLLSWLIGLLDSSGINERTKESLFHSLQVFITWKVKHPLHNRTWLRGLPSSFYFHKQLLRKINTHTIIAKKLPLARPVTENKKKHLINTARSTLVFLYRETEPFTYADLTEITCFELERGLTIVLYGMSRERRLSIESYIGFLAFKNEIPVAYGGGWIFGQRCQFGINILPPFRGGESLLLFSQVLRVYKNYYNIERFVVKPYQFGKNNREALASGAVWFYHKAGFWPEDKKIKALMAAEWELKKSNKEYRTPIHQLKKLAGSNLVLKLKENNLPAPDASVLSKDISSYINKFYNGKRDKAITAAISRTNKELGIASIKEWKQYEKKAFQEWSLLLQACTSLKSWRLHEKKQFTRIIKAKGNGAERTFILLLQNHTRFWKDLQSLTNE